MPQNLLGRNTDIIKIKVASTKVSYELRRSLSGHIIIQPSPLPLSDPVDVGKKICLLPKAADLLSAAGR